MPSLKLPLAIALSPYETITVAGVTAVAVLTSTLGQQRSHVSTRRALALCLTLVQLLSQRPGSLILHALRVSGTSLARSLETVRLCAASPGFGLSLTL